MKSTPIPKRLKEARLSKGISQKTLGIQAGIDEFSASARVNHYERGRHTPDYPTASRLAQVLGVPTAFFFAKEEDLAAIIRIVGSLRKNGRKAILKEAERIAAKTLREIDESESMG